MEPSNDRGIGLRLIVGYKACKSALLGAAALSLAVTGPSIATTLHEIARRLHDNATAAWSLALASWLLDATTTKNLRVVALASGFDSVFSAVQAWALHRRYWWSGWLIVVATSALLPFEAIALARHPAFGRVLLIAANVFIVGYLVRSMTPRHSPGG